MKGGPNNPCSCGSTRKYKKCCRPIIMGANAPTPEALMRSRYTAYATGAIQHIMATTHPDGIHHRADADLWAKEIEAFCTQMTFNALVVRDHNHKGDQGWVTFSAHLSQGGSDHSFTERSEFRKVDSRWLYFAGEPVPVSGVTHSSSNDDE